MLIANVPVRPMLQASFQAAILSAISNLLAQYLAAWNNNKAFHPALEPLLKFFIFSIINTPPNYIWQTKLERWFPSYMEPTETKKTDDLNEKPSMRLPTTSGSHGPPRLVKRNIAKKLMCDQFIGSPINNILFLVGMGFLSGYPWQIIERNVERDFWKFQRANWKVWPLVAVISFSFVPVERRVLFASAISLLWTIYVSFLMGEV